MYLGKLFTTRSGAILDEVKSLLQKSLRRKDDRRVAQCFNELVYRVPDQLTGKLTVKDQLPWGCLLTYLFEDHCLVDVDSLHKLHSNLQSRNKQQFLKDLLGVRTCRVAACLPVYTMSGDITPMFDPCIEVPDFARALFDQNFQKYRHLKADAIMAHLIQAWKQGDGESLMFYTKLINMIQEKEKCQITEKAKALVGGMVQRNGKCHASVVHVVISTLLNKDVTKDSVMRRFLHLCLRFCCVSDSSDVRRDAFQRLILFSVIARWIHEADADPNPVVSSVAVDWDTVPLLCDMPSYAVDKHTYRGKNGRGTRQFREQGTMCDVTYENLHGPRPKKTLQDFFCEGSLITERSLQTNPYWQTTMNVYLAAPEAKQRTMHLTPVFYEQLFAQRKELFDFDRSIGGLLPLLQKPTSGSKVYTRVDIENGRVIKGPYPDGKYNLVVRLSRQMLALGDVHTLPIRQDYPYLSFPLIRRSGQGVQVSKITFEDHIAKMTARDVDFVTRQALGVTQVHNMSPAEVKCLPMTLWVHFALRYALNIGDSGLYNAISDGRLIFGIDMEENRKKWMTPSSHP